jgi:inositol oxygenase
MRQAAPLQVLSSQALNPANNKTVEGFRDYNETNSRFDTVRKTYTTMHENQTLEYARAQGDKWGKFDHAKVTMMEAIKLLDQLVDDSDPDIDLPNSFHAFQTAERIRQVHPEHDWFHLTGLIHDVGKVMALWGQPQWSTVGDTFALGCAFAPECVHADTFSLNPDSQDPIYSTKQGIYNPNCGLDNVTISWGHDEYMYRVLKHNNTTLPDEALYMIRYHSFYPWHTGGAYDHLCNDRDRAMLPWVREFNKFDLYSKSDDVPKVEELIPYYQSLIDKYIPGVLEF